MNRLERFFRKKATGAEILIQPDGSFMCETITLGRKKEEIEIVDQQTFSGIDLLIEQLNKANPILLIINGKGVIGRKLVNPPSNDSEVVRLVLPGASSEDFFVMRKPMLDDQEWVSMIRKETLNSIVGKLSGNNFLIQSVGIGPSVNENSALAILGVDSEFQDSTFSYQLKGSSYTSILQTADLLAEINFGGEMIPGKALSPLTVALDYLLGTENQGIITKEVEQGRTEFWHKNVFTYGGAAALVSLFAVLFINFFIFDHYRGTYAELESSAAFNSSEFQKLKELEAKVKEKTAFIQSTGLDAGSKTSFYADRLAATLPASVLIKTMELNPLEAKVKEAEQINFKQKSIRIAGSCNGTTELNEWIKLIKGYEWVAKVELKDYKSKNPTSSNSGEFVLEIELV